MDERAPVALAFLLFTLGLLEVAEILRHVARGSVQAPTWLLLLAPVVTAAGVLAGGVRRELLQGRFARLWGLLRARVMTRYGVPVAALVVMVAVSQFDVPTVDDHEAGIIYAALTIDFTLGLPALVYVALVRSRRAPWLVLVPAFALGYALAMAMIPGQHHAALETMRWFAIPLELAVVAYLVARMRAAWRRGSSAGDFATRFRTSARNVLGSRVPADILTTEVAILYHAFRWRRHSSNNETVFTMHRSAGYLGVMLGLGMALVVEAIALHLLVSRWSETAAWLLTGLSVYALIWIVGDGRAIVARPLYVSPTRLNIRLGLRWESDVPIAWIEQVERLPARPDRPGRDVLVAVLLGAPNVRIRFDRPVDLIGMYGMRRSVREVRLRVDDVERLRTVLQGVGSKPSSMATG